MIDGIKIDVPSVYGETWEQIPALKFETKLDLTTGVLSNTRIAQHNGLTFKITKSTEHKDKIYYSVRGSLIRYYYHGKLVNFDLDFRRLVIVLLQFQKEFNIDLKTAIIRNLEFGLNITTLVICIKILNSLIAVKDRTFATLKENGLDIGKFGEWERYKLKIYDKGKRINSLDKNCLRIEIAVKKMDHLKNYNIKTLSDLLVLENVAPLIYDLIDIWEKVIYYDGGMIATKKMSNFKAKKFLSYLRPANWQDYNSKQRYRAKKDFIELVNNYSSSKTHAQITSSITSKWNELASEICPRLNHDFKDIKELNLSTFEQLG